MVGAGNAGFLSHRFDRDLRVDAQEANAMTPDPKEAQRRERAVQTLIHSMDVMTSFRELYAQDLHALTPEVGEPEARDLSWWLAGHRSRDAELAALEARVERLMAALRRLGSHRRDCAELRPVQIGQSIPPCDCGFDAALAEGDHA